MLYSFQGKKPQLAENVYIAPGARIIGDVVIGEESSIWYNAVLRGDEGRITIGKRTNIQDNSTLHLYPQYPLIIEDEVTVGHNVILHGCHIHTGSLIGMGATILDGVEIGEYCFIAANTLITPGKKIPPRSFVMGSPGKVIREVTGEEINMLKESAQHYTAKAKLYLREQAPKKLD
ncbi:gamma carbonic anhydrase family protein [Caldalkalibacillus thermarum]|uniref:gamma carbonic anhydrase family protein n=1 Tax=Caldalkalibacillus thermarum TaxID=296745 RepID=UPI00166C8522|nr:gamma carbonic anhydrase family protein [Caldalkalibacillus thermarum]GGK31326.1 gamma carbonic anhydrase family protein [Caldalkalibacillus thermarum]